MAYTKTKLNRSGNSHAGHTIRVITHGFFGAEKLSASERVIINALYSFAQKGASADFTFSEIHRRYNLSYATVSRSMRKILQLCFERAAEPHSYRLKELLPAPERYFYIPDWLRFAQFPTEAGTTDLTNDQIEVLSYILHQNKNIAHWRSTQASIARTLEISPSTVSAAITLFEELKLLTVTSITGTSRAVNHYDRVAFSLDQELLNKTRLETLQHIKAASHAVRDADARTDRERFYAARQKLSKEHAERVREKLGADFQELERQFNAFELELAKAEAQKRMEKFKEIYERRMAVKNAMRTFLQDNGYTEEDLLPRYLCPECNDTGWRKDGSPCTCYTPPGGTP